jgi:hypothetical protein
MQKGPGGGLREARHTQFRLTCFREKLLPTPTGGRTVSSPASWIGRVTGFPPFSDYFFSELAGNNFSIMSPMALALAGPLPTFTIRTFPSWSISTTCGIPLTA